MSCDVQPVLGPSAALFPCSQPLLVCGICETPPPPPPTTTHHPTHPLTQKMSPVVDCLANVRLVKPRSAFTSNSDFSSLPARKSRNICRKETRGGVFSCTGCFEGCAEEGWRGGEAGQGHLRARQPNLPLLLTDQKARQRHIQALPAPPPHVPHAPTTPRLACTEVACTSPDSGRRTSW